MAPVFYHLTSSPPCLTIELVARAIGVQLDRKEVDMAKGEHLGEEYKKVHPYSKVPAMKDGDTVIWDSHAIITYLINKYKPGNELYPEDPAKRAAIDKWLHFNNGSLDAGQRVYYSTVIKEKQMLDTKPERELYFKNALKAADEHLAHSKFFAGDRLSIADMAILGSLAFAESFDYDLSSYQNLTRWLKEAKTAIPFYDEYAKPMVEQLKTNWIEPWITEARKNFIENLEI